MWLGLDFGTTNSALAISDGIRLYVFELDTDRQEVIPSLIYISRDFEYSVGTEARTVYLKKNTGRPSRFESKEVGVIRLDVGSKGDFKQIYQAVTVLVDVLAPGRLFRSIKTGLRTTNYRGSNIFGKEYTVEEIIKIF